MQTILGSGGAIGRELAKELTRYTDQIRLVSRNPEKVNPTDQLFKADLTDAAQTMNAVEGSEVAYLTVGLPYNTKVWTETWPKVMDNVIKACQAAGTKLVFFDNIYMYDPDSIGSMTEDNPVAPRSKKGKVRAKIAQMVLDAASEGKFQTLIARSADFYGPGIKDISLLTETVFNPLSKGKKANCLGRVDKKHSFTYTSDAGKATALLGNTADAYGQVWHLPTAANPPTMKEMIQKISAGLGVAPKYQVAGKTMVRIIGLFVPIMREMVEMLYQYEQDYVFKSDKFEQRFGIAPTTYEEGIRQIIDMDYR